MEAIEEIEKKLANYENQYIIENQFLLEKIDLLSEREKKYKEKILELSNKIDELNIRANNKTKSDELNFKLLEEENSKLNDNYTLLKNNFDILKKELNDEKMKNDILIDKYNKLSYLYEQKEKENIDLYTNNDRQIKQLNNTDFYKNEKDKIIFYCNNTISMIIKWIEINLISFYDSNNSTSEELSNFNNYINIDKNDAFIFDKLRDSLLLAKNNIDDYNYELNLHLKEEKEKIIKIEKENIEINNFLDNLYHHLSQEVYNEKYFDINNPNINNLENGKYDYFSGIEYIIDNIFSLLKKIKESSYNKSLDKLIEDNLILNKEIEKYKMNIIDLYNDNKILLEKNNELQNMNEELKQQLSNGFSKSSFNKKI